MKTITLPTAATTELKGQHTTTLLKMAAAMGIVTSPDAQREQVLSDILKKERMESGVVFMSDLQVGDRFVFQHSAKPYVVIGKSEGEEASWLHIYSATQNYKAKKLNQVVLLTSKF